MAHLLVIDSEPTVRYVIRRILERAGHSVRDTDDFDVAVLMLRNVMVDLVLTNVFLKGIPGHEAMKRLRVEFPNLRVLMVSGLPQVDAIAEWEGEPRFAIFPKPFLPDDLLDTVQKLLSYSE